MSRDGLWMPGEQATFTYGLPADSSSEISARLHPRSGQVVKIVRRDEDDVDDADDQLATFNQRVDAALFRSYVVRFMDGHEDTATEDELATVDSVSAPTPELPVDVLHVLLDALSSHGAAIVGAGKTPWEDYAAAVDPSEEHDEKADREGYMTLLADAEQRIVRALETAP